MKLVAQRIGSQGYVPVQGIEQALEAEKTRLATLLAGSRLSERDTEFYRGSYWQTHEVLTALQDAMRGV